MTKKLDEVVINHVMSQDIHSGIFTSILNYFKEFSPAHYRHEITARPLEDADVYHYHRCQLEEKLMPNSVCTVHHDLSDPDPWVQIHKFLPRYKESAGIVCLNSLQKNRLVAEGVPAEKLHVVAHGYNDDILTPKPVRRFDPARKITLGITSRRYPRRVKGEAYLQELAKRLDPARVRFVCVGQDRTLDVIFLRSLGFEAEGFERLPYRVFNGLYHEMDFLLMASSHEGGPANIPEAVATGTPVLANPIGMVWDMVAHGVNGWHLKMDPDADAAIISKLAVNQNHLTDVLYEGAAASLTNAITWKQSAEGNFAVYEQIIKSRKS